MSVRNRIEVMHGVNLDMLGRRDPKHYGTFTLTELERRVSEFARELDLETRFFQSNNEGEFVDHLHRVGDMADGILLNPGAWAHYQWSLRDALEIAGLPAIEVHISDVASREQWRRVSVLDGLVVAKIGGKGLDSYKEALTRLPLVRRT